MLGDSNTNTYAVCVCRRHAPSFSSSRSTNPRRSSPLLQTDWGWGVVVAARPLRIAESAAPEPAAAAAAAAEPSAQYAADVLLSLDSRLSTGSRRTPAPLAAPHAEMLVVAVGLQLLSQISTLRVNIPADLNEFEARYGGGAAGIEAGGCCRPCVWRGGLGGPGCAHALKPWWRWQQWRLSAGFVLAGRCRTRSPVRVACMRCRQSVAIAVQKLMGSYVDGLPLLDPLEDMGEQHGERYHVDVLQPCSASALSRSQAPSAHVPWRAPAGISDPEVVAAVEASEKLEVQLAANPGASHARRDTCGV